MELLGKKSFKTNYVHYSYDEINSLLSEVVNFTDDSAQGVLIPEFSSTAPGPLYLGSALSLFVLTTSRGNNMTAESCLFSREQCCLSK